MMGLEKDRQLGRYRILSRLGSGGMGEVYRALAVGPDGVEKPVAVKLVREDLLGHEELVRLFVEEAKVSFLLTHPNVVQTYEMGQVDDHFFLVMEYVDGTSLDSVLRHCTEQLNQPMPAPFALYITAQVVRGLDYAHTLRDHNGQALGIVHRDVSPANVLVSWDGQVKVADFGLAKSALRKMETQAGAIKGKVAYMAPEQLRGDTVDARGDVFAVGVMMYEMLAGENPYGDLHEITLGRRLKHDAIEPLSSAAPHLEAGVAAMVDRCLAEDPAARYASARELARELDSLSRVHGLVSSDYGLSEFIGRVQELRREATPAPHPFDRVLGMELERVAGQEAHSTFIAVPSSGKPFSDQETRIPRGFAEPEEPAAGTAVLPPPTNSAGRWMVAAAALMLIGLCSFGGWYVLSRRPSPPPAAEATVVRPDARAPRQPPAKKAPPKGTARLRVVTRPAGATVSVDGKPRGTAPLTIPDLPADRKVRVKAYLEGRVPYDQQVTLEPGATLILQPELALARAQPLKKRRPRRPRHAGYGTLSVNTDPWSVVYVDGAKVGNTPLMRHRLPVGRHTVKLINPKLKLSRQRPVMIRKDQDFTLSVSLR